MVFCWTISKIDLQFSHPPPPPHRHHSDHTKELYPLIWQCAGANTSPESSWCDKPGKMRNTRQHCFSDNDRKTSILRKYDAMHIFSSHTQETMTYVTQVCMTKFNARVHQKCVKNFISQGALQDMQYAVSTVCLMDMDHRQHMWNLLWVFWTRWQLVCVV